MGKHWDHEDDHDWDDNVDYAAKGYVYWYGKYYPKEQVDDLFPAEIDPRKLGLLGTAIVAVVGAVWGASKVVPPAKRWLVDTASPRVKRVVRAAANRSRSDHDRG